MDSLACCTMTRLYKTIKYLCVQFQTDRKLSVPLVLWQGSLSDAWTECTALAAGTTVGMQS
eukprot:128850-Amphidinium_carterae.1